MHARTVALGRAAARAALLQALAIFDAWHDEARIALCEVCLGAYVRPAHTRQRARVYCSAACRATAHRMRHPRPPRSSALLELPFHDSGAAAGPA